jgi:hypothetical protein
VTTLLSLAIRRMSLVTCQQRGQEVSSTGLLELDSQWNKVTDLRGDSASQFDTFASFAFVQEMLEACGILSGSQKKFVPFDHLPRNVR